MFDSFSGKNRWMIVQLHRNTFLLFHLKEIILRCNILNVYVDESGDLGFSKKSTKFFIIAYIVSDSVITIRTRMKRILKKLHNKGKYHFSRNELKFSRMNSYCRRIVLEELCKSDLEIGVVVVEKRHVLERLRKDLTVLFNWLLVHHIMSALVPRIESEQKINIVFDKSLPKKRITEFNEYLLEKASYLSYRDGKDLRLDRIFSQHMDSEIEPCLQAADAVAGAYFQKYENEDGQYVEMLSEKISYFKYLWRR